MTEECSMTDINRHTLVWMNQTGRQAAWESAEQQHVSSEHLKMLILNPAIPGIIRRQEVRRPDSWEAGFSSWEYENGSRMRTSAVIPADSITEIKSPFEIYRKRSGETIVQMFPDLKPVFTLGACFGIDIGIYGSTALQWMTGYPYRNAHSDYDLYLKCRRGAELGCFYKELQETASHLGVHMDAEVEVGGYAVKLKEWMSNQKTVLGKGLYGADILRRDLLVYTE